MKRFLSKEWLLLYTLILSFIFMRAIHFTEHLNFSTDQANFSSHALTMWQTGKPLFQGPTFSIHLGDRWVHHGPYIYYIQLLFLFIGGFDPIWSSFAFTVFCGVMVLPLYFGTKKLLNEKAALLVSLVYAFFPYFVHYTRFFWNPNYQLALLPILIYLMGHFKQKKRIKIFFLISLLLSILFQLHYQFFIILIFLLSYFFIWERLDWRYFLTFCLSFLIGFIPLLIYEVTHHFANLNTLLFFMTHLEYLYAQNKENSSLAPHYFLSLSFLAFFIGVALFKNKLNYKMVWAVGIASIVLSLFYYLPQPEGARGMAEGWNYLGEEQVHQIIVNQGVSNFNVVNLDYDTLAEVQKYLLLKDNIHINEDDYYSNQYLYVISAREDYSSHPAYEIGTFKPSTVIKTWEISRKHKLYLLKRIT